MAFAVNGVGRLENFQGETAIALAFEAIGHPWVAGFIYLCAFLGITASAFINMMGQSRLLYSLAKDGLFFETFKQLSPISHVPIKGAWVSCIAVCLLSVILDVEELTFIISVENLFTFSITNSGLMALRFREHPEKRHPNEIYAWYFMVLAFFFSLSWGYSWPWPIIVILGIAVVGMIIYLHRIPQLSLNNPKDQDTFMVPLVPLIPCLATLTTFALCGGIPSKIWFYFIVFEMIGACFYFFYGINHSLVGKYFVSATGEIELGRPKSVYKPTYPVQGFSDKASPHLKK